MARLDAEDFLKRARSAQKHQSLFRGLLDLCFRYVDPQRGMLTQISPGARRGVECYDGTAPDSLERLTNRICADVFPEGSRWVELMAGTDVPEKMREQATRILQDQTAKFHELIDQSNFRSQINAAVREMLISTGALLMEDGGAKSVFRFRAVTIAFVAIDEGRNGDVDGCFVGYKLTAKQIVMTWPQCKDHLPPKIAEALSSADEKIRDQEFELIHGVYEDLDTGLVCVDLVCCEPKASLFVPKRGRSKNYAGDYAEESSAWIVFRWAVNASERYGRGPVIKCLPTILTANKTVEYVLMQAGFAVAGAWTVADDGVTNPKNIRVVPGAFIPVGRNEGHPMGPSIASLVSGAQPDWSQWTLEDLRMFIKEGLYDQRLPSQAGPVRSPTEIVERVEKLAQDLGDAFGRIVRELVTPIVVRGLQIMAKRRLIEYPVQINGSTVKAVPTGPLAQMLALKDVRKVVEWMSLSTQLAGPEATTLTVKIEEIPAWLHQTMNAPSKLLRTPDERKKLQDMVAMILAQMEAAKQGQPPTGPGAAPSPSPAAATPATSTTGGVTVQ